MTNINSMRPPRDFTLHQLPVNGTEIEEFVRRRASLRRAGSSLQVESMRLLLLQKGIEVVDHADGSSTWRLAEKSV